ncbi:MAG: hypothetical protein JSW34_10685 [Candidatus Zixiibacteriota bacterium]|nr:MAG: hypothetical protein JSW34_10685 [candidate division Zixibacteria bacterium]
MFTKLISWKSVAAAAIVLLVSLALSCSNDSTGPQPTADITTLAGWGPDPEISGGLVSHSDCKSFLQAASADYVPVTETTVEWEYDGNGTLDLRHINGGFNCCPDLSCEISVVDRVITVVESDAGQCLCLCLLDVDYQITGLPPGKYLLRFEEAVEIGGDDPLECEIVLKGTGASGTCVVDRTQYPWGVIEPEGSLLGWTNCFYLQGGQGRITWDYDVSQQELIITHIQYTFWCPAASAAVDFDFAWSAVTITEYVTLQSDCMWPMDPNAVKLNMKIINLLEQEYSFTVNRPFGLAPLTFTLDLANEPTGSFDIPWK